MCKSCENFGLYEAGLSKVRGLVEEVLLDGALDLEAVPEGERDPVLSSEEYKPLIALNKMKRRVEKVNPTQLSHCVARLMQVLPLV